MPVKGEGEEGGAPEASWAYGPSDGRYLGGWGWLNRIMFPDGSRNAQSMTP